RFIMANITSFDITIEDVQGFLYSIGFTWKHRYYNHKLRRFVDTKTFDEIVSDYPYLTTFELYSGENMFYVDFFVTPEKFIRYRDETNIMGSGSSVYADKDYSKQWPKFIVERKHKENIENTNTQAK
ncbi:MAG: hypothetical protein IJ358_03790, partial [Clostridia bacterium]|nr:hypothetical protein [Clostridia bacterium]